MNQELFEKILTLSENRVSYLRKNMHEGWYQGSETHLKGIYDELDEVQKEIDDKKYIYLEDELGDVFWDYLCFLEGLEQEGKIEKSRVFERCLKKFSGRLNPDGSNNGDWNMVKKLQKEQLRQEQENSN